ncbi:unnamed protein product [Acanthoscelides obtectus]|uniref:Uncharacterized protein n=1 Tax=Acanthoscelides obtectus TaxID=200917 RepID=A0A9P0M6S3_ACAOB|nr:unnamed protein product [Acanthoscelides obtectus]CAK1657454.1 hypothetical protein AOBTE_LOCUS20350 [Acanthoscelides obtectus]
MEMLNAHRLVKMDSSSEFSSESDPYHDSDNYDMDPDYVLESESGNKNGRKCFIKSLSNAYSVTAQHALKDDKEQDEEINKASTSGINQTPILKHGFRCDCRKKCFEKFTEMEKDAIFTEFYAMGDKNIQDSYLAALIDVKKVSRRRKTSVGEKKNRYSYGYSIKISSKTEKVTSFDETYCNGYRFYDEGSKTWIDILTELGNTNFFHAYKESQINDNSKISPTEYKLPAGINPEKVCGHNGAMFKI